MLVVLQGHHPDVRNRKRKTPDRDPQPVEQAPDPNLQPGDAITHSEQQKRIVYILLLNQLFSPILNFCSVSIAIGIPVFLQVDPILTYVILFLLPSIRIKRTSRSLEINSAIPSPYSSLPQNPSHIGSSSRLVLAALTRHGICLPSMLSFIAIGLNLTGQSSVSASCLKGQAQSRLSHYDSNGCHTRKETRYERSTSTPIRTTVRRCSTT